MTSTYYNWFRRLLILGAVVATGVFASTAGAMPQDAATTNSATTEAVRPPDVQDSATALYSTQAGLKADGLRLQGMAQVYRDLKATPDVFERYAAAHPFGQELSATSDLGVSRPPDVRTSRRVRRQAPLTCSSGTPPPTRTARGCPGRPTRASHARRTSRTSLPRSDHRPRARRSSRGRPTSRMRPWWRSTAGRPASPTASAGTTGGSGSVPGWGSFSSSWASASR